MRDEARSRVRRFTLTGLEGPEELWERLRETNAEVEALAARNDKLTAEMDALRRRLRGAGGLTDEELAAELPLRMTRNLAAAQEVAADLVEQARNDVMLIRLDADQVASQIVGAAKAEAARIVRGTLAEAEAQLVAAKTQANEVVRAAHAQRSQIVAELDERSARMQAERHRLQEYRQRLEQAYDQVARTLAEARAALGGRVEAEPYAPEPSGRRAPAPRSGAERGSVVESPPVPEDAPKAAAAGNGHRPGPGRSTVFDWSGAPAAPAAAAPPAPPIAAAAASGRARAAMAKGVLRSSRLAAVDAAAG